MLVYRLAKTKHASDLTGEGSRLHGGRWNHIGVPCIYTSASRALAVLEYTVNTNIDDIPRALSMVTVRIPDDDVHVINVPDLPGSWTLNPISNETKTFGSNLLNPLLHLVIKIPSVVLSAEFNYILNSRHPRCAEFVITDISDFVYDVRIKNV